MDQNGEMDEGRRERARQSMLPIAVAVAVLMSGFNALVQIVRTLAELSGLVR